MTKPLSPDDPILGPSRYAPPNIDYVTVSVATSFLARLYQTPPNTNLPEAVSLYLHEANRLARLVGICPEIVIAQWALETDYGRSEAWVNRRNPAGIGILGDPGKPSNDLGYSWKDGTDAARAQIVHIWLYLNGNTVPDPLRPYIPLDPRAQVVLDSLWVGTVRTIRDLARWWATDKQYAEKIAKRGNELFGFKEDALTYPTYPVLMDAKTGREILVESPVPIVRKLIPLSKSWIRPGIPLRSPWGWIQHETGNPSPGANAEMHYRFLMGLPEGTNVSFHFVVDDHQIIQLVPCNEVTWQAADGNGDGNFANVSCEGCINSDGNEALMRRNCEYLAAGVLKANDGTSADVTRHWDWNAADPNRHHCPDHMMNDGYWPTFVANVDRLIKGGSVPPTTVTYPAHMDKGIATRMFGSVKGEDGKTYAYSERSPISALWLNIYDEYGWPAIKEVWVYDGGARRYVRFHGGPTLYIGTDGIPSIMEGV